MQADEAGMPTLNFMAMLDDAQAAARNRLSSVDEELAAASCCSRATSSGLQDVSI